MKKFVRICIITALILIVLGGVITAAGASMGGFSKLKRSGWYSIFNIPGWKISIGKSHLSIDKDKSQPVLTGDYSNQQLAKADEVSVIDADIGGGRLVIKQSDNEYFKVEISTDLKFQCFVKNGELNIKAFEGITDTDDSDNTVTLYIPDGASIEEVEIELGAGTVDIDKLTAGSISFDVGAGKVNVDNMDAHKVSAELGAGKIDINGTAMDAEIDIDMGSFKWTGNISRNVELSCDMGSVDIGLKEDEKGHNYKISCSAGKVAVGGKEYTSVSGDMDIDNGAPGTFDIDCSMGKVNIYFTE